MKAIAIVPGTPDSVHVRDVPRPGLDRVPDGRGARVRMIRVGLCGTDADLASGRFGIAPEGADHLVLGHESLARVVEVGSGGDGESGAMAPGQLVVVTIRRPGNSVYDRLGSPDLSTDDAFLELGIRRGHGLMVEEVVDDVRYLVPVPERIEDVAVLAEPLSCITKSLRQAEQVQVRLGHWEPRRALVTGAGTIGLLATLTLRLRGLDVTTYSRRPPPYRNSLLVEEIGARYVGASDDDLAAEVRRNGPFDIVFEGSGAPGLFESAVHALAPNGVLALFSVTPGAHPVEIDVASLNQAMVLGNRVMVGSAAAAWDDYAQAVDTLDQAQSASATRGWLPKLFTTRIEGFDAAAIAAQLADEHDDIKATVEFGDGSR